MSWLRIDDGFAENDKVLGIGDRAFRLHLVALCYSARNLLDGILNERQVDIVCAVIGAKRPARYIEELVQADLWIPVEEVGGFELNDYLDYNPSSGVVKKKRAEAAERQRRWREHQRDDVTGRFDNALGNDERNALRNAAPSPGPSPKDLNPTEPVGNGSGEVHDLDRLRAASRLYDAIPVEGRDDGTERVVLGYARELDVAAFDQIRRSLVRKIGNDALFKTAGAYVNGALQKAARKAAKEAA